MGDEDSFLSSISRFSQIANFSSEQLKGATDRDRGVVYQVAQKALKELHNPAHLSLDRQNERQTLGKFIHNMEALAPRKEDRSAEAAAFRTTLAGLQACQLDLFRKGNRLYAFYMAPNAVEQAQIAEGGAERRQNVAAKTGSFIDDLIQEQKSSSLPESDLKQIYRNLCAIGLALMNAKDAQALALFRESADRFAEAFGYSPVTSVLKKERLADRIQERISELSLNSSHLREDVRKIKEDIAHLKQLLAKESVAKTHLDRLDQLGKALDELVHPHLSKISKAEYEIIREAANQRFESKSPEERKKLIEKKLTQFAEHEKRSMQSEQTEVLSRLQTAAQRGLRNLVNEAPALLDGMRETAIRGRFKDLEAEQGPIKPGFSDQAFELVQTIEQYGEFVDRSLHEMWETRLHSERFDALGDPSQRQPFFDKYPYVNPQVKIDQSRQLAIQVQLQGIKLDANAPSTFRASCAEDKTYHKRLFAEKTDLVTDRILWLVDQAKSIRIP